MLSYSVIAAVSYVIGLLLSPHIFSNNIKLFVFTLTAFVLLPISVYFAIRRAYKSNIPAIIIAPVCLFLGIYITGAHTHITKAPLQDFSGREITVTGVVASEVTEYSGGCSFIIKTAEIEADGEVYKVKRKIKASSAAIPNAKDTVILTGVLEPVKERLNSTSFDRVSYYNKNGIYYTLYSEGIIPAEKQLSLSFFDTCRINFHTAANEFIEKRFNTEEAALLKGIILNNKSEMADETVKTMEKSGTYRYIYSSYIHICLIIFIISRLIRKKSFKNIVISCLLVLYLLFNAGKPSAWKICLFIIMTFAVTKKNGIKSTKTAIALTVLLTAIISPLTVVSEGFILSLSATILITAFSKHVYNFMLGIFRHRKISSSVAVFFIFTVLMIPVMQTTGFYMTVYSYFAGILLMPVMSLVYLLFPLEVVLYILTGGMYVTVIPELLKFITLVSEFTANLPGARIILPSFGIFFTGAFYYFLYGVYLFINKRRYKNAVIVSSLVLITAASANLYCRASLAEVSFVNVGQGDCCVIKLPTGDNIMIDGGGGPEYSDYNVGDAEVIPYLYSNGISKLDLVILSHYDKDHAQGVVSVLENVTVKEIVMPDYADDGGSYRDEIETLARDRGVILTYITENNTRLISEKAKAEFIYTDRQKTGKSANDCSLITMFTYGETKLLFTGDITRRVEAELSDIDCDILKIPHHGSKTSTSEKLLMETTPDYCVFSLGEDNIYGFPHKAVTDRCLSYGGEIMRTDLMGDIHFYINDTRISRITTFK